MEKMNVAAKRQSLEIMLKKKATLEYLHEFETRDDRKSLYASELQDYEEKSRELFDRLLLVFEKCHLGSLGDRLIDGYEKMEIVLTRQYLSCENCKGSHFWPDGSELKPEEKGYCSLDQGINLSKQNYGESCCMFEFYNDKICEEYNRKLTYINKKINQINRGIIK